MKLGIVIIHYNTSADLERCLESLASCPPGVPHEIVVVDNASVDPGLAGVHERYPSCRWLFNRENVGYARGCNQGMAEVAAEYHLVLNPDIVVQPGALDRLLDFADRNPRAGLVGPQLLNEDGTVQASCRRFYTLKTLLLRRTVLGRVFPDSDTVRRHLMEDFDHQESRPVDWVLGGCLLVRTSALERTGPMDERFFLYFEDVDWCFRMWQAGYEVQYTPEARFVHRHRRESAQGKFNRSFWLHLGSLISFYEKWGMVVWLLKKWRDPLLMLLWWVSDLAGLAIAFWAAYGLRAVTGDLFAEPLYSPREYVPLLAFAGLLASATFLLTGRYGPGNLRQRRAVTEHLRQIGIVGVLLMASTYLGHQEVISRAVLLIFIPLLAVATGLGEAVIRWLLRKLERGHLNLERTLLVGAPGRIRKWHAGSRDLQRQGVDVAGYVADPAEGGGMAPLAGGDLPWLGPPGDLVGIVHRYRISQVVFWEAPGSGGPGDREYWRLLATLRRLRVRLRWQIDGAWLLAAGARPEVFGQELGAVQGAGSGVAVRALADRVGGLLAGLTLGLAAVLPWLWLRAVRVPRGGAAWRVVTASDLWGHDPVLKLAVDADGKVLPLWWQWRLAGPLLRGAVNLSGDRASAGVGGQQPPPAPEVLEFWRSVPRAPGLTGSWAGAGGWGALGRRWRRLWQDPGGFGCLDRADDREPKAEG